MKTNLGTQYRMYVVHFTTTKGDVDKEWCVATSKEAAIDYMKRERHDFLDSIMVIET